MGLVGINANYLKYAASHSTGLGNFSKLTEYAEMKKLQEANNFKQYMDKFGNPLYEECMLPDGLADAKKMLMGLSPDEIFKKTGMVVHHRADGKKIIEDYTSVINGKSFSKLGVDENKLIKDVVKILSSADIKESNLKTTSSIQEIMGNLHLNAKNPYLQDASSIKKIGGFINISGISDKTDVINYLKKIKLNPKIAKYGVVTNHGFNRII